MPSLTPNKVGVNTLADHVLTQVDTTGSEYKIAVTDPSNVFILVQPTTLSTGTYKVTVTASTGFPTSKGQGNFVFVSTSTKTPSVTKKHQYVIGPFESARFVDVSTSGRTLGVTVASTSDGVLPANSVLLSAFEIFPST